MAPAPGNRAHQLATVPLWYDRPCGLLWAQALVRLGARASTSVSMGDVMKLSALVAAALCLLAYLALMRAHPAWGLLQPRGGLVMLGLSLAAAVGAIVVSTDADRPLNTRFQLAAAGWIWLGVQALALAYLLVAGA